MRSGDSQRTVVTVNQDEHEKRVETTNKKEGNGERRAAESSHESSAAASSAAESDNGNSSPGGGGGWSALGMMKDRATMAKNQLAPQLLSMKQRTSKRCVVGACSARLLARRH